MSFAQLSTPFAIYVFTTDANPYTVVNPGRAFRIVSIEAQNNNNAATRTVTITDAAGNAIAATAAPLAALSQTWLYCNTTLNSTLIDAGENLIVQSNGVGMTVVLYCTANPMLALT